MFVFTLQAEQRAAGMAAVIPTLLERANKEGGEAYVGTSARLLELASADQAAFRGVVGSMTEVQKSFLETVITTGRQTGKTRGRGDENGHGKEPTIALRMDFGG